MSLRPRLSARNLHIFRATQAPRTTIHSSLLVKLWLFLTTFRLFAVLIQRCESSCSVSCHSEVSVMNIRADDR